LLDLVLNSWNALLQGGIKNVYLFPLAFSMWNGVESLARERERENKQRERETDRQTDRQRQRQTEIGHAKYSMVG